MNSLVLLTAVWLASAVGGEITVETERNVAVPMRDGVVLRADVHRPSEGGPYPVLVMRTPYGKGGGMNAFVKAGYIVVTQDARGRYESDGKWESFVRFDTHDAEDGYDTVEWAARLPGANGKVATFGASYNAFLQWRLAPLQPPSLVAMAAFSIPARYTDLEGPGTIRPGRRLHWWTVGMSPDMRTRNGREGTKLRADAQQEWDAGGAEKWLNFAPYLDLPRKIFEDETEPVHYWLKHPHADPWKLDAGVSKITVPNLNVIGWWDHCNGGLLLDRAIRADGGSETARKGSRTIIGPWSHVALGKRHFGNIDFGPAAVIDLTAEQIRWFDHWLKGKSNGVAESASYRIFIMGDNRWRDEPTWPLERAQDRVLYLASSDNANTPAGDGRLVDNKPHSAGADRYTYDPTDPVRSLHGPRLFQMPADQRPLADRQDILVYQTEPLAERVEVTGIPEVELYAASSAPDTDFFVRLIDVHPDGLARDVSLGMVRARYRNGLEKPELIEPGQTVKYKIRMNPTSNAFLPGHRIRLDVCSSDFPNYDRNHNTSADQNADGELKTARQTIRHGAAQASRVILPWVAN
jgi:putative CocE/NonD family hydrolase